MPNRFSKIVSIIFHPMLMSTYILMLVFSANMYFAAILTLFAKLLLILMVFSSTVIMPAIIFSIFLRKNIISSFHMESKEERMYPYLVVTIMYFIIYLMISQTAIPSIYSFFMVCATILSLVLLLINFRYKISAHTAGIGGLTGLLLGVSFRLNIDLTLPVIISIACAGLIGYARLNENAHKPSEVYSGFLVGVFVFLLLSVIL